MGIEQHQGDDNHNLSAEFSSTGGDVRSDNEKPHDHNPKDGIIIVALIGTGIGLNMIDFGDSRATVALHCLGATLFAAGVLSPVIGEAIYEVRQARRATCKRS